MKSRPGTTKACCTASSFDRMSQSSPPVFSVRCSDAASGRMMEPMRYPWSSAGTKDVGTRQKSRPTIANTTRPAMSESVRRASAVSTPRRKNLVVLSNATLKGWKIFDSWSPGFSSSAQSAGVSVNATKPEITTATVTVTANCL